MSAPAFALVLGLAYTGAGVLGLMGFLPVGALLSAINLAIGLCGFVAWAGAIGAVGYARLLAIALAALAIAGLLPMSNAALGFAVAHRLDVAAYAATALLAAYFGYRTAARGTRRGDRRISPAADRRHALRAVPGERRHGPADRRFGSALASGF